MFHRVLPAQFRVAAGLIGVCLFLLLVPAVGGAPIRAQSNGTVPVIPGSLNTVPSAAPSGSAVPNTLSAVEGGTSGATLISATDDDEDDNVFYTLVTSPQHGTLNNFPDPDTEYTLETVHTVTYAHDDSENFNDFFEFSVRDTNGDVGETVRVDVTITPVNDNTPVADDGSESVAEGGSIEITLTGSDTDGDNLTFAIASDPVHGTLSGVTNEPGQSATVTYTHDGSENYSDSFEFTVSDGVFTSAVGTIDLTINPVNDNEPIADDDSVTVNEGGSIQITLTGSDADGGNLTFAVADGPDHGSLSSVANSPGQSATVTYTHDGSETTADEFTFTVFDGKTTSGPATITITIDPVNDRPTAVDDFFSVVEDSGFTTLDVLDNDEDPEGDAITITAVTQPANGEAVVVNGGQAVQYRPDEDYCNNPPGDTRDTFRYTLNGGSQAQVRMRVDCVDDPLVATDQNFVVIPDEPLVINTLNFVEDPDGDVDPASVETSNGPEHGDVTVNSNNGRITYTPASGYVGPDGFDYTVCDEQENCDTGRFSLFVSVIDLHLVKDDGGVTVRPGALLTYTLSYSNTGNAAATGVVISETVPVNAVFDSGASSGNWSCSSGASAGATCRQNIGRLDVDEGGTTVFALLLLDPLAVPAGEILNRASISGNDANGPELTPADNVAETRTPIETGIDFAAFKTDLLTVDADDDGLPSPGDTLHYSITMTVTGNAPAAAVLFTDPLNPATELVTDSVTTSAGTILANDSAVEIALGDLAIDTMISIGYDVTIRNPVPAGISQIANQGLISGNNFAATVTDDPDTPQPNDPTVTFLEAEADLTLLKAVALGVDADANGLASPADTLLYTLTLVSGGNQSVAGIRVIDELDSNVTVVPGTLATSRGVIVSGSNAGDTTIEVDIGTLAGGGESALITYSVRVNDSIAGDVDEIVNQAVATSENLPDLLSDDLTFNGTEDPTRITINANAKLFVTMEDFFVADVDENGVLSRGDLLFYRVEVFNNGNRNATELILEDEFDPTLEFLPGTVSVSTGNIELGNGEEDDRVRITAANLAGGAKILISYQVRIGDTGELMYVSNQASLRYLNGSTPVETVSDDPDTAAQPDPTESLVGDPTAPRHRLFLPFVVKR